MEIKGNPKDILEGGAYAGSLETYAGFHVWGGPKIIAGEHAGRGSLQTYAGPLQTYAGFHVWGLLN